MNRKAIILLFFISIVQCNLLAQSNIDSLFQCVRNAKDDEFIRTANELHALLAAEDYAEPMPKFSRTDSRAYIKAHYLYGMFVYYYVKERYVDAIAYKNEAIAAAKATNDSCLTTDIYAQLATCYLRLSRYEEALELTKQSLAIETALDDHERLSSTYNTLAGLYLSEKQYNVALQYSQKAITIERELATEDTKALAIRLGMESEIYLKLEQPELALTAITEAADLDSIAGRFARMAIRLAQKGDVLIALGKDNEAETCFLRAIPILEDVKNFNSLAISHRSLGAIYSRKGRTVEANAELQKSLTIAEQSGNIFLQAKTLQQLYKLYRESNPTRALEYFERYDLLNDSLYNERSQEQINQFRIQYDTQEKEYEIALNKITIHRQRTQLRLAILGIISALITLLLLVFAIISERRRREMLAKINATKDKFFAIISHDLKNPAVAQNNMLQQINDNIEYLDNESTKHYIEELLKSSNAQVELLYELLDWSRIQTGRMECQLSNLDIKTTCDDCIALLHTAAEIKNITLINNVQDQLMVVGDTNMVHTIVRNLIQNAIKYTPEGGMITLQPHTSNGQVSLDVQDTGIGITASKLKTIFRIDATHSTPGTNGEKGTGLGLLICHDMAALQKGSLTVQSTEGVGSTFTLTLPTQ